MDPGALFQLSPRPQDHEPCWSSLQLNNSQVSGWPWSPFVLVYSEFQPLRWLLGLTSALPSPCGPALSSLDLILILTCRFTFWLDLVTTLLLYALDSWLDMSCSFGDVLWDCPWPMRALLAVAPWWLQAHLPLGSCPTLAAPWLEYGSSLNGYR